MSADDVYGPPPQRAGGSGRVVVMPDPHNGQYGGRGLVRVVDAEGSKDREKDEPLPLPGWLLKLYFLFPIILYIPDALFNYHVYSDGAYVATTGNAVLDVSQMVLWFFLSIGVVGMAYLLSVLAPYHWMRGAKIQAVFCGIGVVIATAITVWNSLAYRSEGFKPFATDQWVYGIWPQLQANQVSLTMIFAAVAPPFWGLFWAVVQPTQRRRDLAHLAEGHAERMMRLQHEAEIKTMRAEANAKIRAAQLKGMAQTAAAAREQMGTVAAQWRSKKGDDDKHVQGESPTPAPTPAPALRSGGMLAGNYVTSDTGREATERPVAAIAASLSPAPRRPRPRAADADVLTLADERPRPSRARGRSSSTPQTPDGGDDEATADSGPLDRSPAIRRGATRV